MPLSIVDIMNFTNYFSVLSLKQSLSRYGKGLLLYRYHKKNLFILSWRKWSSRFGSVNLFRLSWRD